MIRRWFLRDHRFVCIAKIAWERRAIVNPRQCDGWSAVGSGIMPAADETDGSSVERLAQLRRENERRWEEFIPGDHNRLVYTAANMVLEKPGQISPLFIFGPHGCGKSHLAIGLAHRLKAVHRMRRVLVLTGEQFTIEFTESGARWWFCEFPSKVS